MAITEPSIAQQVQESTFRGHLDTGKVQIFRQPPPLGVRMAAYPSAGVLYGYIHVAERAWLVAPLMWLLLMVMVPPMW